ncbi:hypothetical protein J6590_026469 [Homalodisca vitripennis]|nr:hypothetical protein J6590_026469 [Homalodisca vitripennis]
MERRRNWYDSHILAQMSPLSLEEGNDKETLLANRLQLYRILHTQGVQTSLLQALQWLPQSLETNIVRTNSNHIFAKKGTVRMKDLEHVCEVTTILQTPLTDTQTPSLRAVRVSRVILTSVVPEPTGVSGWCR